MNLTNLVKTAAWIALLAGVSAAGLKYVAVVDTDMDAQSGASESLNPAEVRLITSELRRMAVENLPRDKYNIMTSETVQSMSGAVLTECAEENCVIALGNKIGADYIVRGIISKFQTMLVLTVEMYETENGTLVAASSPVRFEKPVELLEMAAVSCRNMYKTFAGMKVAARKSKAEIKAEPKKEIARKPEAGTADGRKFDYYIAPKYQQVVWEGFWPGGNIEGGVVWGNGMFAGLDFGVGYYDDVFVGGGVSFGNVYDLGNQLQLVYGGSVGIWYGRWWWYDGYGYYDYYDAVEHYNILAPFVKLRWKFVELTYRGLLGWKWGESYHGDYDYYDGFSYNQQLMLGLYFATSKRTR